MTSGLCSWCGCLCHPFRNDLFNFTHIPPKRPTICLSHIIRLICRTRTKNMDQNIIWRWSNKLSPLLENQSMTVNPLLEAPNSTIKLATTVKCPTTSLLYLLHQRSWPPLRFLGCHPLGSGVQESTPTRSRRDDVLLQHQHMLQKCTHLLTRGSQGYGNNLCTPHPTPCRS